MEKALDEALEESPELLQQVDGINDSDVEWPGKVEIVEGEPQVEEDGGGWEVVHSQHKARARTASEERRENRMGSYQRMAPVVLEVISLYMLDFYEETNGIEWLKKEEMKSKERKKKMEGR